MGGLRPSERQLEERQQPGLRGGRAAWMADDNGSQGWEVGAMRRAAGEAAAAGAAGRPSCCGWRMAMRSGKRANTKVGRIGAMRRAAGEAAAAGAAGRPSCCGWRMAMAGRSGSVRTPRVGEDALGEACEHQGSGGLAQ